MNYACNMLEFCRLCDRTLDQLLALIQEDERPAAVNRNTQLAPSVIRKVMLAMGHAFTPETIAFINLKGGVGKTTSSISLASRAAQLGYKVCVLDLDAQASATLALDMEPDEENLIFHDIWQNPDEMTPHAILEVCEHFFLLPSSLENSLLDVSLMNPVAQKNAVSRVCQALAKFAIDLIVIDCPPSLGAAVISAACAADTIIVPACIDSFSFRGIELTVREVTAIRQAFALPAVNLRILPTMIDRRLRLAQEALNRMQQRYGDRLLPVDTRFSCEYAKAQERKQTIYGRLRKSHAREDYDRLVRHLLHIDALKPRIEEAHEYDGNGSETKRATFTEIETATAPSV